MSVHALEVETNADEMEPTNCIQHLTKHEESLNRFLNELETREQNFTESLKKIGDTLETLVNVKSPEIPEFLLRVPSKHFSMKKKKNKKRSRSINQCIDDSTAEFNVFNAIKSSETSEAMNLKNLAKKFEKFLKKAKKHGLSRLIGPIKESARRLRELSQTECSCEFETILDTDKEENEGATPCNCNEWSGLNKQQLCICDTCEQMCNCHEKHFTQVPDTRKKRRHHKPKDKKIPNICLKDKIPNHCDHYEEVNICEEGKIADNCDCSENINICEEDKIADNCDCSEDIIINALQFDVKKKQEMISESCNHEIMNIRETSKSCEDLAFGQFLIDPECLKNDLCILKSLLQNLTTISKLVVERDCGYQDLEISRFIRDQSMIHIKKSDKMMMMKDDCTNVKDEECQCVDDGKESGRTNRLKKRLKDHMVKDEDETSHEFNVKRYQTSCNFGGEASRNDKISRSLFPKEIVIIRGTCNDDIQSDSEENLSFENYGPTQFDSKSPHNNLNEKNICPCGCDVVDEPSDQLYPGSCKKVETSHKNVMQSIMVISDHLKTVCPCGCADMLKVEDNKIPEIQHDILLRNDHMQNRPEDKKEDIEKLSWKLENKIHSVKAKNDKLKQLMKTCYCDDDVDEILALQCSQPPPIRATRSGLTAAIQVLQSKCHTKDRMINVLASELRGFNNVDQIAKNLTAPCLQFTYWDFDQCNLYSYLQKPKLISPDTKIHETDHKFVIKRLKEETNQLYQTPRPTNFRVIREICNCLLVAWNIPDDIRGLKGYEIVVNSNVVAARVRNPTRTEAVLGPFDQSGFADCRGSIILTLYAIDSHGQYSAPLSIKF